MSPVIPIALLALGAGAVGFVLLHGAAGTLPAELQSPFNDVLTKGQDPDKIDALATKLEGLGYQKEAAQLRARSALLRGGGAPKPAQPAPGPSPAQPAQPAQPAPTPRLDPLPPAPPPAPAPGPALPAQFMKVTTHDPAPSGDLALRSDPIDSASVIGAAEKDSVVTVKNASPDGQFLQVEALNPAGRRQSATGWAHVAFLVPTNPMQTSGRYDPTVFRPYSGPASLYNRPFDRRPYGRQASVSGRFDPQTHLPYSGPFSPSTAPHHRRIYGRHVSASIGAAFSEMAAPLGGASVRNANPHGLELRSAPTFAAGVVGVLAQGAVCLAQKHLPARKHDTESPSPGGWTLVTCGSTAGWAPSEWLAPHVSSLTPQGRAA
jgi:hypothetical protein